MRYLILIILLLFFETIYSQEKKAEVDFEPARSAMGSFSSSENRKLEKTRQLLRRMINGRAIIFAKPIGTDKVELTIGSYQEVRDGGSMWMPGGAPGEPMTFMYGAGFSREWIKSARFKSLLSMSDYEKTSGDIGKPLEERIETYTKKIKIPGGCEGIYPTGQRLAYYYLDRKTGKLVISAL